MGNQAALDKARTLDPRVNPDKGEQNDPQETNQNGIPHARNWDTQAMGLIRGLECIVDHAQEGMLRNPRMKVLREPGIETTLVSSYGENSPT